MSNAKIIILNNIGHGKGGAISRNTLSVLADVSEDHVSKIVRELKYGEHELICTYRSNLNVYYYHPQTADDAMESLEEVMEKEKNVLEYIHRIQSFIERKTEGVINFNNLPDVDFDECKQTPYDRRCSHSDRQDENEVLRDVDFYQELQAEYEEEKWLQERERKSTEEIF